MRYPWELFARLVAMTCCWVCSNLDNNFTRKSVCQAIDTFRLLENFIRWIRLAFTTLVASRFRRLSSNLFVTSSCCDFLLTFFIHDMLFLFLAFLHLCGVFPSQKNVNLRHFVMEIILLATGELFDRVSSNQNDHGGQSEDRKKPSRAN